MTNIYEFPAQQRTLRIWLYHIIHFVRMMCGWAFIFAIIAILVHLLAQFAQQKAPDLLSEHENLQFLLQKIAAHIEILGQIAMIAIVGDIGLLIPEKMVKYRRGAWIDILGAGATLAVIFYLFFFRHHHSLSPIESFVVFLVLIFAISFITTSIQKWLLAKGSHEAGEKYQYAQQLVQEQKWEEALDTIEQSLRLAPNYIPALCLAGEICYHNNHLRQAWKTLQIAEEELAKQKEQQPHLLHHQETIDHYKQKLRQSFPEGFFSS